jgi:REP element-mobilizing transposase RayT
MTTARSSLVDVSITRWYHCVSRCVRQAHLMGGDGDRKGWAEVRLEELSGIFAISVAGFGIMDNHLHLLIRIDPEVAENWSAREVVQRWFRLYPPKGKDRKPLTPSQLEELIETRVADTAWAAEIRSRLSSLSWFMKCLKEPLSRLANKADKCRGAFFEGRYKSIAILDTEALLAVNAYIDLNPLAAGLALTPEESEHTSVKARVDHVKALGRIEDLQAAKEGSVAAVRASKSLEDDLWLIPIEDRRNLDSSREGMLTGFTLGNYLLLVDYTGRMLREGKASINAELASILDRIGGSAERVQAMVARMSGERLFGRFIAGSKQTLCSVAERVGVSRLANLSAS